MMKPNRKLLFFLCMAVMTGCCIYVAAWFIGGWIQKKESRELAEQFHKQETEITQALEEAMEGKKRDLKEEMNRLAEINEDLAGWITIEGTDIDYPVVQAADNQFYLTRNFYKESNSHGAIFMDYRCNQSEWENRILYGHHMKDGTMFHQLSDYKSREFYEGHPTITYYDREGISSNYEVIGVFYWDGMKEDAFPFYDYIELSSQSFQNYISNVQKKSLYTIPIQITGNPNLLSLITCDYTSTDARLVVVGAEVTE